jgi:hypothetical protein
MRLNTARFATRPLAPPPAPDLVAARRHAVALTAALAAIGQPWMTRDATVLALEAARDAVAGLGRAL